MVRWHRHTARRPEPWQVWSPPSASPRQPSAARITARLAGRAIGGYARWVARSPETRGLASGLIALYPLGAVTHLASANPLLVAIFAVPAAVAAWVGTWKAHRSRRYSAAATATAAGVPTWLAVATVTGIGHGPVLLGYTSAAVATWSAVTWSDVLTHRRSWRGKRARWETIATAAGLENSRLTAAKDTHTGQRFIVDIRATGKTARQLAGRDLAERIAAVLALPAERVRVTTDKRHAGNIIVTVQTCDPWAAKVTHPALDPAHVAPRRSVMDAPLVLGTDPDTGNDLDLTVYDDQGGWHTFIVAATGGGKTTCYSNIIEQATGRADVIVWAIDLRKGTIPYFWEPALDATAGLDAHGNPEYDKALKIVAWGAQLIKLRSATSGGRNHVPTPDDPAVLIVVDEGDTLLGAGSPIAHKAREFVADIQRGGRSAGVALAFAGQRGVVQYTGSKDTHANSGNKIVLRVQRAAEMNNIIDGWELAGMPDMSTYAPGAAGVALVVGPDSTWHAGRVRDLHDLDAVAELARRRGRPTAALPDDIAAALPGYAERNTLGQAGDDGADILNLPTTRAGDRADRSAAEHRRTGPSAITRLSQELVDRVDARLADMPDPPARPTPLSDLLAARAVVHAAENNDVATNQRIPVPDHIADPILTLLDGRRDAGARRDEIVATVGRSRSAVAKWLAIMRDHGLVTATGAGKAARYHLPEHASDTVDEDTLDDDVA